MKRIGPNVSWRFRIIAYVIFALITLLFVFSSCSTYTPPSGNYRYERTESPYEKYRAKQLQREQLRYYQNQNNK